MKTTTTKTIIRIDNDQGEDKDGRNFGYIHLGDTDGGFFFTIFPDDLESTLDSIEPDSFGGSGGKDIAFAERVLRKHLTDVRKSSVSMDEYLDGA